MQELIEPIMFFTYVAGALIVCMYFLVIETLKRLFFEVERMEQIMRINEKVTSQKANL